MSLFAAELRLPQIPASLADVARMIFGAIAKLSANLEHRRQVLALKECDEALLKDIGLTPSDVRAALDKPWSDDPSLHLTRVAAGRSRYSRSL